MINNVHEEESIPKSWLEGNIIRLYKGKGQKGKCSNERGITLASNVGKVYERVINERVKEVTQITDDNLSWRPKSIRQGMAGCNTICSKQEWSGWEKPVHGEKTKFSAHCQHSNKVRPNKRNQNKRQHKARWRIVSHRIRNPNRRNI